VIVRLSVLSQDPGSWDAQMGKDKSMSAGVFFREIFQTSIYKRSQGRVSRQVTCAVVWVVFALAAWRVWINLGVDSPVRIPFSLGLLLAGFWLGYRLVNMPAFADFLIAVEAEMNKVSWPSRGELVRSAAVVIIVIFLLAAVLFGFDIIWQQLFVLIGVRPG
jgi:preprotein translocase subunit SecE